MYTFDFSAPGHIYFVGIGGISMSGLAEILVDAGFRVSGSDRAPSAITKGLEEKGIQVFYGQAYENITADIDCVVFTSAIHPDNPEYMATMDLKLSHVTRAELLGQLMKNYKLPIAISGTHGKTTTTSMVSEILMGCDTDPTLSIGGILRSIGGNVRVGGHNYFLTEACEYTNSFLSFFPKISIILNVEEDHLDFFKDLADIRHSFQRFGELLPADGTLIINGEIENYKELTGNVSCRVLTFCSTSKDCYGEPADIYPADLIFDDKGHASFRAVVLGESTPISLQVPGTHNVLNALAAFGLSRVLQLDASTSADALHNFTGTDRRFEYKGTKNGVTIIDDYAHHPTEIGATIRAAKQAKAGKLWIVFQPHTYTRTKAFLEDFASVLSQSDAVVLADIYAARETDTLGVSSELLQQKIAALGTESYYFPSFAQIEEFLLKNCTNSDMLITMGAGDVYKIGESILSK